MTSLKISAETGATSKLSGRCHQKLDTFAECRLLRAADSMYFCRIPYKHILCLKRHMTDRTFEKGADWGTSSERQTQNKYFILHI